MFFKRSKNPNNLSEEELRQKLMLLLEELENLKKAAEDKLRHLEDNVEQRISELEAKLQHLEERLFLLNQVLMSLDPSRRLN